MQRVGALGIALLLVAPLGAIGCRKPEKGEAKATVDAGTAATDAAAPSAAPAYEMRPIARVHSYAARLVASSQANPKVMLDAGMLVYEVAGGTVQVLGDRGGYSSFFLRPLDEAPDLAGYTAVSTFYRRAVFTANGLVAANPSMGFRWNGTAWQKLDVAPGVLDAPDRADGIPKELQGRDDVRCLKVPSFGAKTDYAVCKTWRQTTSTTVWKKVADEWASLELGDAEDRVEAMAVGSDERPWLAIKGLGVFHLANGSADLAKAEKMPAPELPEGVVRTSYEIEEMGSIANGDPDAPRLGSIRYFFGLRLHSSTLDGHLDRFDQIVPLPNGEAYVLAQERGGHVLFHVQKPRAVRSASSTLSIGSEGDQRAEILNTKPLRGWIGRCPHVFVIATREKADGSLASGPVFAREKELRDALQAIVRKAGPKNKRAAAPALALVEGRSGGKRVAGAFVWRGIPEVNEDLLDKIATELGTRFTSSPAEPAEATCTPPVIDRAAQISLTIEND